MNQFTVRDVQSIPRIRHDEAMRLAKTENERFTDLLESLDPAAWSKPTDCPRWSVKDIAAHVIGSAAAQASPREFVRQVRQGRRLLPEIKDGKWWDGMNELQVVERRSMSGADVSRAWTPAAERALTARRRLPRPVARLPLLPLPDPVGRQPVSYLFDAGFTRDVWMHRIDIARASDQVFVADSAHDGRLLEDVVAEWAATHGEPFDLILTGEAGGHYTSGSAGERVELDAIDFARTLAGRATGDGLLRHPLPL